MVQCWANTIGVFYKFFKVGSASMTSYEPMLLNPKFAALLKNKTLMCIRSDHATAEFDYFVCARVAQKPVCRLNIFARAEEMSSENGTPFTPSQNREQTEMKFNGEANAADLGAIAEFQSVYRELAVEYPNDQICKWWGWIILQKSARPSTEKWRRQDSWFQVTKISW